MRYGRWRTGLWLRLAAAGGSSRRSTVSVPLSDPPAGLSQQPDPMRARAPRRAEQLFANWTCEEIRAPAAGSGSAYMQSAVHFYAVGLTPAAARSRGAPAGAAGGTRRTTPSSAPPAARLQASPRGLDPRAGGVASPGIGPLCDPGFHPLRRRAAAGAWPRVERAGAPRLRTAADGCDAPPRGASAGRASDAVDRPANHRDLGQIARRQAARRGTEPPPARVRR